MTSEDLDELEAIANAGTPGKWNAIPFEGVQIVDGNGRVLADSNKATIEDMILMARSRDAIPQLIAEVRRLTRELELERAMRMAAESRQTCNHYFSIVMEANSVLDAKSREKQK